MVIATFGTIKAIGISVLAFVSASNGKDPLVLLGARWDSLWYARVAEHGYDFSVQAADGRHLSSMAFFPLLPWLEELGGHIGITSAHAGLLISLIASFVAALGMFKLGCHLHSVRAGFYLVCLWASLPVAIVQSMAYSESLFVALSSWGLYALIRERWIVAGVAALLVGLTRPVGLAMTAAVFLAALIYFLSEGAVRERRDRWKIIFACAISPMGAVGYILWVGLQEGSVLGYFQVQGEWGNGFDGGIKFAQFLAKPMWDSWILAAILLVAIICLMVWPHWVLIRQRHPLPVIAYSAILTLLAVGASGYFGSKPRFLVPAFPLLIPLAIMLARSKWAPVWLVSTTAISAIYGAVWLNGSGPP